MKRVAFHDTRWQSLVGEYIFCLKYGFVIKLYFIVYFDIYRSVMKPDQERVKQMLTETILLLCKNGLHFQRCLTVQGLLGITLDEKDIFMIHLNEVICPEAGIKIPEEDLDQDCSEVQPEISSRRNDCGLVLARSLAETVDDITTISAPHVPHEIEGPSKASKVKISVCVKSEPSEGVAEISESNDEIWIDEQQTSALPQENCASYINQENMQTRGLVDVTSCKMLSMNCKSAGETFLSTQDPVSNMLYDDRVANVCEPMDFQNSIPGHSKSRHEIHQQMGSKRTDRYVNTHNTSPSRFYKSLAMQSQFPTTSLFVSRYRPKNSTDKEYHCTYPGCSLSFYARRTLLRHQTQKHGRPKSYIRYGSKHYALPQLCNSP